MTDQGFREVQLSGKQIVFLFIASVVVAVAVFLLGVSVGRGTPAGTAALGTVAADIKPSTEMPPETTLTSEDMQFDASLQGKPPVASTPQPPAEPAAVIDEPVAAPDKPATSPAASAPAANAPATTPPPASQPTAKPAAAATPSTVKPSAGSQQGWMLQIGAFKSKENADAQVRQLISKGYSAVVVTGGSLFRVRVGPYAERADADKAAAKLKSEGISSSVTR
jgi:cell division protein FtsN